VTQEDKLAIRMRHISKSFGTVVALDAVDFELKEGEIHALLGENGSGKTTLMNILSGIYYPDDGDIAIMGQDVAICSPKDAFNLGIGMIHQHFKLVDVLSVAENIVLGLPPSEETKRKRLNQTIRDIADRYGFDIKPESKIYDLSVSEKQTVEIIKVLYRGANMLILDEPTAVLTPQETEKLFDILRAMKADNKAIVIITHKLNEVLAVSDRVTILRKGQKIDTIPTATANRQILTEMMVGRKVDLQIERPEVTERKLMLQVNQLTALGPDGRKMIDRISFDAYGGEILGVAGISGSGQKELCEAIAGLCPVVGGSILFETKLNGVDVAENLVGQTPEAIIRKGISLAFVPEDRLGMGLVASHDMIDNVMLKNYRDHKGPFVDRQTAREAAEEMVDALEIVTPGVRTPIRQLSGGNVQKVLLGREIRSNPQMLMVAYPVRGLDINASFTIYRLLNEQKMKGVSVIFVGEDLDVLMEISDRLLVLCHGRISGIVDPRTVTKEHVGLLMTGGHDEEVGA
jgi:simple sugar transport system ATP-binding protein